MLVTLAPGANPRTVLDLLFQRKTEITNHCGNLAGYLDWTIDTAKVLRNQIRQSDIDRLVFTPRLWRLQEMSGRADRFQRFGVGEDGRLFRSAKGNPVASSTYSRVWQATRPLALLPHQVDSPLAGPPYDLRHTGVSLWLNAGVHAPEVAERAGHSVDVLLKVYAKCIDGDAKVMNERIEKALAT